MRLAITALLCLLAFPANAAETVIYEMTSGIALTCNDAVSSVDMVMESATASLKGASNSVKSVCKCQVDGAGNCTKDADGNESWFVIMQWVK